MGNRKKKILHIIVLISCIVFIGCTNKKEETKDIVNNFTPSEKSKMGINQYTSLELYSNPVLKDQYFVKVVTENDWFEALYRVVLKDGKKTIEHLTDEASIIDDVIIYTKKDNVILPDAYIQVLLAVTSSSHMGNGGTTFYAFKKDGTMEQLFYASGTVDRNKDSTNGVIFENGKLYINLSNNENKKYSDIECIGREYIYGVKEIDLSKESLYKIADVKRVYSYNHKSSQYQEVMNSEKVIQIFNGVISYHEYWKKSVK